jgi:hypothetical protein
VDKTAKRQNSNHRWAWVAGALVVWLLLCWLTPQILLSAELWNVSRVRILECGSYGGKLVGKNQSVLFDTSDPKEINELKTMLSINGDTGWFNQCLCFGGPTLELHHGNGVKYISIQDAKNIRPNGWFIDAQLARPAEFVDWLAAHVPLETWQKWERIDTEYTPIAEQARLTEFRRQMPESIKNFLGPLRRATGDGSTRYLLGDISARVQALSEAEQISSAKTVLSKEFPKEPEQIKTLLTWIEDLGMPSRSFQFFPLALLLTYEPEKILAVAKSNSLTNTQWIGLSRFYSSMDFRDKFPYGYAPLDEKLKQQILSELNRTGKNESDIETFKEAIANWMYPVRLQVLLEKKQEQPKTSASQP